MGKKDELSRRGFIAGMGLTGLGSVLGVSGAQATEVKSAATRGAGMPIRPFGKTGEKVSILSLGGMFDITDNQIILKKALDYGITHWDTANGYNGGKSETGIGMYFEKYPEIRKKVFLVTKTGKRNAKDMLKHVNLSLERMKTDHIDLLFIHAVRGTDELNDEMKAFGEQMKKEKKIRFFGFSTHNNMGMLLQAAPKLGWVDAVMMTYNHRVMDSDDMKAGVEACYKAGIALTAMKVQGGRSRRGQPEAELKLAERFIEKGFTPQQAKLKAVWQNEMIATICSQMPNLTILAANAAAAVDKTKFSSADERALRQYADATAPSYCAGCQQVCDGAMGGDCDVADVMRYMMYHQDYGETALARELFAQLPAAMRQRVEQGDFSAAEKVCPQGIAISSVMKEASKVLG